MIGGGGQRRVLRGVGVGSGSRCGATAKPGAVPRADPRAGPAVSRQEPRGSQQELGGWTDHAHGVNAGSLWDPHPRASRCPVPSRHSKPKGLGVLPLALLLFQGNCGLRCLPWHRKPWWPGLRISTSPPLRGLWSTTSRILQKMVVSLLLKASQRPPNPTRSRYLPAPFGTRGPNSLSPPASYPSHPISLHDCFLGLSVGPEMPQDSGVPVPTAQPEGCGVCVCAGCLFSCEQ